MGQNSNYAAVMDAQSKLRDEECASGMVQRSNYAAAMDARARGLLKVEVEECALALGMGKADEENYEVLIDAQNGVRDYIVVVYFYPEHDSFGLTPDLCMNINKHGHESDVFLSAPSKCSSA